MSAADWQSPQVSESFSWSVGGGSSCGRLTMAVVGGGGGGDGENQNRSIGATVRERVFVCENKGKHTEGKTPF